MNVKCTICPKVLVKYKKSYTGKSFSEAHILASTNPQYEKRLFIELRVQYMKITSSKHVVNINWFLFWHSEQFMYTTCTGSVIFMYWTRNSMHNLLSYCVLVDARKELLTKIYLYSSKSNQFVVAAKIPKKIPRLREGLLNFHSNNTKKRQ